jgi:DNA-binding transcriptional LysR family regulator
LFERSRAGYRPTAACEEMIGLAGATADSIIDFERRVVGRDVKPSGELRVTTTDAIAIALSPPILARFRAVNPGVQLDLIVAAQTLNLSRRDADVAIRAAIGGITEHGRQCVGHGVGLASQSRIPMNRKARERKAPARRPSETRGKLSDRPSRQNS